MSSEGLVGTSTGKSRGERLQFLGTSIFAAILAWTAVVGVGRTIGPLRFTYFSAQWGLYFGLVGLLYGYQQEVTRRVATTVPDSHEAVSSRLISFPIIALATMASAAAYSLASLSLNNATTGPVQPPLILAVGCAGYVFLAHMNGVLAGRGLWRSLSFSVLGDSLFRFVALWVLVRTAPDGALTFGIVSGGFIWIILTIKREYRSALTYRTVGSIDHRIAMSMIIAGCSAILVSGFPFLVISTSGNRIDDLLGSALAAVTAIRAPVMVAAGPASVLLMERTARRRAGGEPTIKSWRLVTAALMILGTLGSWVLGPPALSLLFSKSYAISGAVAAAAFLSSVLVAVLMGTGTVLMARDRHAVSIVGWIVTLLATVLCLATGLENEQRLIVSLLVPPMLGCALHLIFISRIGTDRTIP